MNTGRKIWVILLSLCLILALLPLTSNRSFISSPSRVLEEALSNESYLSADQVAKLITSDDNTFQLVDLRQPSEFLSFNIPGSINVPYNEFIKKDPGNLFTSRSKKYIFYSNNDLYSNYAMTVARGMNYKNAFVLKGGLNEWFKTIMNTTFTGERITARENALFSTRRRAGQMFTELNSMPDSLKKKYVDSKRLESRKLDGGCE